MAHPTADADRPPVYQIRLRGHLAPHWTSWFEPLRITAEPDGDTILTGEIVDQAALHGILRKIRDLGLPLLSVTRIAPGPSPTIHGKDTP